MNQRSPHRKIRLKSRIKATNRKCLICGTNPWPNYFYCPACHTSISRSIDIRDRDQSPAPTYRGLINAY